MFDQIIQTLHLLSPEQYAKPLDIFEGSSVGKHFRHIFDFYLCIEKSMDSGVLDYCLRERHPLIETDPIFAVQEFNNCFKKLAAVDEAMPLRVLADFSTMDVARPEVKSSFGRELMYAFDHAVHHLAIIKIGIKSNFPEINLEKGLGIAPSTLKHEKASITQL